MNALESRIKIELWSPFPLGTGTRLMDLSGLATNRQLNKTRNDADEISFDLDLREFQRIASLMNEDSASLLIVNQTEVRASERGVYIGGGQINLITVQLDDKQEMLQVKAYGFINIFGLRYSDYVEVYTNVEITSIVLAQLSYTQGLTNGNLGISVGHVDTVGPVTWQFRQQDLKSGWQDLASLQAGGFDIEITADKVLNLYALQGAYRNDMILEYGGNVKSANLPIDGTQSANQIIALGAGIGASATVSLPPTKSTLLPKSAADSTGTPIYALDNLPAQENTTLLQNVMTYNGAIDPDTLLADATSTLSATAYPVLVGQVVVKMDGPYLSDISIGDYFPIDFSKHPFLRGINGYYRLERYEATIDDEDNVFCTMHLGLN